MYANFLPCAPIYECDGKKSIAVRGNGEYATDTRDWADNGKRRRTPTRKNRKKE